MNPLYISLGLAGLMWILSMSLFAKAYTGNDPLAGWAIIILSSIISVSIFLLTWGLLQ